MFTEMKAGVQALNERMRGVEQISTRLLSIEKLLVGLRHLYTGCFINAALVIFTSLHLDTFESIVQQHFCASTRRIKSLLYCIFHHCLIAVLTIPAHVPNRRLRSRSQRMKAWWGTMISNSIPPQCIVICSISPSVISSESSFPHRNIDKLEPYPIKTLGMGFNSAFNFTPYNSRIWPVTNLLPHTRMAVGGRRCFSNQQDNRCQ